MADKRREIDMTTGSPAKKILAFTLPLVAGNMLQQLYNMVDSAIAGKYIGMNALGAVSNGFMIVYIITTLFSGLSTGGMILIAQYFGRKDEKGLAKCVNAIYLGSVAICVPVMIIGIAIAEPLLITFNVPEVILPDAVIYVQVIFMGLLGTSGYNINSGILSGLGNSRMSLVFLIISCCINLVLDILFVVGFSMGVFGTALATVIAQWISWIMGLLYMKRKFTYIHISINPKKTDMSILKTMLKVGIPSSITGIQYSIGTMLLQSLINSFGPDFIAGVNAASKIDGFVFMIILGFFSSASTYTGQNIGAGKYDRVRQGLMWIIIMCCGSCLVLSFALYPFSGKFMQLLFSLTDEARLAAEAYFKWVMLPSAVLALSYVISGTLRGAGSVILTTVSGIIALWIVRVPTAYYMAAHFGKYNMFSAYIIGWAVGAIICGIYFLSGRWKKVRLIDGPQAQNMPKEK